MRLAHSAVRSLFLQAQQTDHELLLSYRANLVIVLAVVQVAKKIPFEDPNVLNAVRAIYVASNVIILGIYLYIQAQIDKKKGTKSLSLREEPCSLAGARKVYCDGAGTNSCS